MNMQDLVFRFQEVLTSIYMDLSKNKTNEAFLRLGSAFAELNMLIQQMEKIPDSKKVLVSPVKIKSIFDNPEDKKNE